MIAEDKILNVAKATFFEKGIKNTEVQEIAKNAGVSKKPICNFFEEKNQLVKAVYLGWMEEMNNQMNGLVSSDVTFVSKLIVIIQMVSEQLDSLTTVLIDELKVHRPNFPILLESYLVYTVFDRFKNLLQTRVNGEAVKPAVKLESLVLIYREAVNGFIHKRSEVNLLGGFSGGSAL